MQRFKIEIEENLGDRALIAIEPLEQGYGHTLGNSLRRCMLSSLEGGAITSVKINGVSHQFSTIKGVVEDVIHIILNLKKVRVKIYGDKPTRLSLQKSGEGQVKASDIDTLGQGEIINPDLHIATITDPKIKLGIEMMAEKGSGYVPASDRNKSEIGALSIDAIFSPVISVNYSVDSTRVGRKTDFDKLVLDVTTDGTITPLECVNKAAQIMSDHFKQIYEPSTDSEEDNIQTTPVISDEVMKSSVEELDLPVRITNALKAIEIDTIGKMIAVPKLQLMKAKNLGTKSLTLISDKLSERGLSLSET